MVARWDRAVVEAFQHAHWGPADWLFELLSDWWVKSILIVGVGLAADLWLRRWPRAAVLSGAAFFAASGLDSLLKQAFERPRPPLVDPAVHPLIDVPSSYSLPSGHASTAFAAAVAVGLVHARLRWPLIVLAALIGVSRVWLGVHYLTDVLAGATLGAAVAATVWLVAGAAVPAPRSPTPSSGPASSAGEGDS
jgi:membrane-associated phospholipid phosphatase